MPRNNIGMEKRKSLKEKPKRTKNIKSSIDQFNTIVEEVFTHIENVANENNIDVKQLIRRLNIHRRK